MSDSIYLKKNCDICGWSYFKNELMKQNGLYKCIFCYDQPPPSTKPLGGEGDVSGDARSNSGFDDIDNIDQPDSVTLTSYIVTDSSNVPIDTTVPYTVIAGSATLVTYKLEN